MEDLYESDDLLTEAENRIRNLMWTVSGDYRLDTKLDLESWRRSKYISLYDAVKQGAFARFFDREGRELTHTLRAHDFAGVAQRYSRVPAMMDRGVSAGRILRAECVLLEAVPMWDAALRALRRDPYALVERVGPA